MIYHTMQMNPNGTYTVGVYGVQQGPIGPAGRRPWYPLKDFSTFEEAAKWVHFLNGGPNLPA